MSPCDVAGPRPTRRRVDLLFRIRLILVVPIVVGPGSVDAKHVYAMPPVMTNSNLTILGCHAITQNRFACV